MGITSVTAAALSALAGSATTITITWLRTRAQRLRAHDQSRRDTARHLPPGSRIVDLGAHGMIIDVGSASGGTPHD